MGVLLGGQYGLKPELLEPLLFAVEADGLLQFS